MNPTTTESKKEYTILKETLNLSDGFNMRNSVMFQLACHVYMLESSNAREVFVTNLSREQEEGETERYVAKGNSAMNMMMLEAPCGSLLEIKLEGVDSAAEKFRDDLKRGLNEEEYLRTEFYPRFQALKRARETDYERLMGLRSLYKRE
jgi:phosphotransferase system HPr-like phosphotransfer protein